MKFVIDMIDLVRQSQIKSYLQTSHVVLAAKITDFRLFLLKSVKNQLVKNVQTSNST